MFAVLEKLLHLIPVHVNAMRASSLEQQVRSLIPSRYVHREPVVERGGASRKLFLCENPSHRKRLAVEAPRVSSEAESSPTRGTGATLNGVLPADHESCAPGRSFCLLLLVWHQGN